MQNERVELFQHDRYNRMGRVRREGTHGCDFA